MAFLFGSNRGGGSRSVATTPMYDLQCVLYDAYLGNREVNYFIAGDSNRAGNTVTGLIDYYQTMLGAFDIRAWLNAESAHTALKWQDNTASSAAARMQYAIDNALGVDGVDTIVEFSFGVNDINTLSVAATKTQLKNAIEAYLLAKPAAHVLLCVPSATVGGTKSTDLQTIYQELAAEMSLPLVDGYTATINVAPDPLSNPASGNAYYAEHTHINDNGGRRMLNYILHDLIHPSMSWVTLLPEYSSVDAEPAITNEAVVETGLWSYLGAAQAGATWRRMQEVTVVPKQIIRLQHLGTRLDVMYKDSLNVTTRFYLPPLLPGQTDRYLIVPDDMVSIKVNVESVDGAAYDLLGDTPILQTAIPASSYNMPVEKINLALPIRFKTAP